MPPVYYRESRKGRLGFSTKLNQGVGAIPDTVKNWVFNTFILLFYNQVLGIEAFLVSIMLAIAIVFDAVTDPLVASYSDNLQSRWGRRHPLMLVASVPLGIGIFAIFVPPPGLDETGLLAWLLCFVILTRGLMTLFFVPWAAMAAELSDDYHERTSVMSYRYAVGWIIGVSFPFVVYSTIMTPSDAYPVGQLNPAGYPAMALAAGLLLSAGAFLTTILTFREIPYLRQHRTASAFGLRATFRELKVALGNRQFLLVFTISLLVSALAGTTANISIYMTTFFWGFNTDDLRWFVLSALGAVLAFPLVAGLQRRWDKKQILLLCAYVSLFDGIALVLLRFMDVLPDNGDPLLLVILVGAGVFAAGIAVIQGIISASVVADVLDDHELRTGLRQEGMFFAALSFSGKAVSSVGIVLGGLIITLIEFPINVQPAEVSADLIFRLGLVVGIFIPLLYLIPISLIYRYRITREVHAGIQEALETQRMETQRMEAQKVKDA